MTGRREGEAGMRKIRTSRDERYEDCLKEERMAGRVRYDTQKGGRCRDLGRDDRGRE